MNTTNPVDKVTISRRDLQATLNVLRSIDARGYDSMYKLVSVVEFLDGKMKEQVKPPQQPLKPKVVDHEFGPRLVDDNEQN